MSFGRARRTARFGRPSGAGKHYLPAAQRSTIPTQATSALMASNCATPIRPRYASAAWCEETTSSPPPPATICARPLGGQRRKKYGPRPRPPTRAEFLHRLHEGLDTYSAGRSGLSGGSASACHRPPPCCAIRPAAAARRPRRRPESERAGAGLAAQAGRGAPRSSSPPNRLATVRARRPDHRHGPWTDRERRDA